MPITGPWVVMDDGDREFTGDYDVWISHDQGEGSGEIIAATWREYAPAIAALPELVDVLRVIADLCRTVEASGNWFDDAGFTLMHHKTFAGSIKLEQLRRARALLARLEGL